MAVERLRYFTGLFLEEPEFTLEQVYHQAMRRRMNYALFNSGVLFGLDVIKEAVDRVRVDPGMAIDRVDLTSQGREIVLTAARQVSLSGFGSGSDVFIAMAYNEQPAAPKPPLNIESRTSEEPLIQAVLDTGGGFTLDQNVNIVLARVRVGDLSAPDVVPPNRRLAVMRLGGGTGPSPITPTVATIAFSVPPQQGSSTVMTITGTNLGNNPQVAVLTLVGSVDAQITSVINAGLSNNTTLVVNVTISVAAALGDRQVRVATDGGTVTAPPTPPTAFTVVAPGAAIGTINPTFGRQTVLVPVTIGGSNFTGATVTVRQNDTTLDANITVGGVTVNGPGTSIAATFNILAAAAPGGRRVRVQTATGPVDSVVNFFDVRARPIVLSISPTSQSPTLNITVRGTDIRNPALIPGNPATGTTVRFEDPGNPANSTTAATVNVLPDLGGAQRLQVTIPAQGALPPTVNLFVVIEGATALSPSQFTFV